MENKYSILINYNIFQIKSKFQISVHKKTLQMYSNMCRQNNQYTPTHLINLYRIGQGDQHNKYCNRRLIPNIRWLTTSTKSKRLIETFLTCYGSWFSCMRIIEHKLNQYDFLVSMSHAFDYS